MTAMRRSTIWLALVLMIAAVAGRVRADGPGYPPLFGTQEIRSTKLAPFHRWTGMVARQMSERELYDGPCSARRFNRCHLQEWQQLLRDIAGQTPASQLDSVNSFMNRAPYVTDPVNYGVPDYWATPLQFMNRDGDCEDYAIAKFVSLRQLGFGNGQMRVVVVDDLNLHVAHAILVVYLDGRAFVLDNQIAQVVPADIINHYRPIYSINEDAWWLHRR